MRPVLRPVYTGTRYTQYKRYLEPLLLEFGPHCSYCERMDKLDVEHVVPKSCPEGEALVVEWDNLLLGCSRCNRDFKRNHNTTRDGYLWPDEDDTFSCFDYKEDGRVQVKQGVSPELAEQANKTLALLQLDDSTHTQPALCLYRRGQFKQAKVFRENYLAGFQKLDEIVEASKYAWSVWMTVFHDQPEVVTELVNRSIVGTNNNFQY